MKMYRSQRYMKGFTQRMGEIATRYFAFAGHDVKIDMYSYKEPGLLIESEPFFWSSLFMQGVKKDLLAMRCTPMKK